MKSFIVQTADGYFIAADPQIAATEFATYALRMTFADALDVASLIPGARIIELQMPGEYAAEDLLGRVVPLAAERRWA